MGTRHRRRLVDRTTFPSEDLLDGATPPTDLACLWLAAHEYEGAAAAGAVRKHLSQRQRAVEQLRTLAKPYRLRVRVDAAGFPLIPGRYGQIEWQCDGVDCHSCPLPRQVALAVCTDRPRLFEKLWAIPGVKRHQTGDTELRAVFPPEALEQVARVIWARRHRELTPKTARELGAKTAYRTTYRP